MTSEEFFAKVESILGGVICEDSICKECVCYTRGKFSTCWCDDGNDQFGFPDGCSGFVQRREEDD